MSLQRSLSCYASVLVVLTLAFYVFTSKLNHN